jgi:phosphoglycolate phosphatase-like HAD superfamily hydrolase
VSPPLLLLWDIDGTLLQRASLEHAEAMRAALARVHASLSLDGHQVEAAGRTDAAIARDLLVAAGRTPDVIDARADDVIAACCELYDELCPADLSSRLAPGIPEALGTLGARPDAFRFSLVTGNFERVARLKLARAGIGDWFPAGQGAFGSDAEDRELLPPIARARAGDWPRERTVVIGDTPRDIACARADGLRVVAVATGPFGVAELADADAVVDGAAAVVPILEDWA